MTSTAPRITTSVGPYSDVDGNVTVDTPFGPVTYLEYDHLGQRIEGWPRVQFGDEVGSEADLAATVTALRAFLDDVDPSGVNRRPESGAEPVGSCIAAVNRATELRAREMARDTLLRFPGITTEQVIALEPWFVGDRNERAAWSRAEEIMCGPTYGPLRAVVAVA